MLTLPCSPFVELFTECKSVLSDPVEILSASCRVETGNKNNFHIERFANSFHERCTDPIQATNEMGIEFLTEYFKTRVGYSSVNTARSVLPSFIKPVCNVLFWKLLLLCRPLKGVFNIKPVLSKNVPILCITKVCIFFQLLSAFLFLLFKSKLLQTVTWKTVFHRFTMDLCLPTGQGDQTIECLNLDYIKISSDKIVLLVPETARPGDHLPPRTKDI